MFAVLVVSLSLCLDLGKKRESNTHLFLLSFVFNDATTPPPPNMSVRRIHSASDMNTCIHMQHVPYTHGSSQTIPLAYGTSPYTRSYVPQGGPHCMHAQPSLLCLYTAGALRPTFVSLKKRLSLKKRRVELPLRADAPPRLLYNTPKSGA